jgi:hypothetical protein
VSRSAADCIKDLLGRYRPARLLIVGPAPGSRAEIAGEAETRRISMDELEAALGECGHFDFAVVAGVTGRLDTRAATELVGRLKNLHADRFLLLVDPGRSSLDRDTLLALALAPLEHLDDGREAWLYDIDRYNPEREWNNPQDWAHPENFEKFRW